jgi:GT2 family glycosyltransferase
VSVIIPTIGRPEQLRTTLDSLAKCHPRAAEIIVIDQSQGDHVAATVAEFAAANACCILSAGRGIALAVNEGLRRARNEIVLGTHDDCSVAADWVDTGYRLASSASCCILTGRVLPLGDPTIIPSTKDDPRPHDFTGELTCRVLFPSNMVLPRSRVLEFGGFDERFEVASEDNDLCYRWLRAGRCLRYEPSLTVWHRDWRTGEQLREMYVSYWREQGRFYAKHLHRGDAAIVRFMLADARYVLLIILGVLSSALKRRKLSLPAEPHGLVRGLLPGFVSGWRDFRR